MTSAYATQGLVLEADVTAQPARVTQGTVLLGTKTGYPARATQAAVFLGEVTAYPARITQAVVLVATIEHPCLTEYAQCWKLTRQDGEIFAFTSLDTSLDFKGVTYQPCDSLSASAIELGAEMGSVGNGEIDGIISDDSITDADLAAGLFDNATVEVWMVPWGSGDEEPWRMLKGVTGKTSQGEKGYTMEILTAAARLQQKSLVEIVTAGCRYELGDSRCTVDIDALAVSGAVTAIATINASTASTRRFFSDSGRSEADGYFAYGILTWLTGANAGAQGEIKDFVSGQFTLWQPMNHAIQIGDTYSAVPGCDKAAATCKATFSNYVNFGGFPDVPGQDAIVQTPDAKQ